MTPAAVHHSHANELHAARAQVLDAAYESYPERFVRKPPVPLALPTAAWMNKPRQRRLLTNSIAPRLNRLDKFRSERVPQKVARDHERHS